MWTSRRGLIVNTGLNLLGQGVPLLAAVVAIPLLVSALGTTRFGVLALAWAVAGYFTVFDLGLGRAATKRVAELLERGDRDREQIATAAWSAVLATFVLGVAGGLGLALVTPVLAGTVIDAPARLDREIEQTFLLVAAGLPFVVSTTALRGVLEAHGRFGLVNLTRAPIGAYTFLGPAAALAFTSSLPVVVAVLIAGRIVGWGVQSIVCVRAIPELRKRPTPAADELRRLAAFGGWLTVSNLVAPVLLMLDRFLIGALVSASAVAFYVVPYDAVNRLLVIAFAVASFAFPAFSSLTGAAPAAVRELFLRSIRYLLCILFPIALGLVTFASDLLDLWLGSEFARESELVLQLITIGVFVNSLAAIPYALVQATGRPDLTAKLHLLEVVPYVLVLVALVSAFGIKGAALAWVLRILVDSLLLTGLARRVALRGTGAAGWSLAAVLASSAALLLVVASPAALTGLTAALVAAAFGALLWTRLLDAGERQLVLRRLRLRVGS